jgi:hypothetical protein
MQIPLCLIGFICVYLVKIPLLLIDQGRSSALSIGWRNYLILSQYI